MGVHVFVVDSLDDAVPGSDVQLTGAEGHHAASVLRLRAGEAVEVVDGRGRRIRGVVEDTRKDSVTIAVGTVTDEERPQPRVVVVQAVAKGDRGERAVELMTEVGVDAIVPWQAEHAVSRWRDDKAERGADKWRAVARAAAKQSRRAYLPEIHDLASTADLASVVQEADMSLVLDETATLPIAACMLPVAGTVVLVVGPEGGISVRERETFASWGATFVRLGPTVLRTSTAGSVAAAVVMSGSGRWSQQAP